MFVLARNKIARSAWLALLVVVALLQPSGAPSILLAPPPAALAQTPTPDPTQLPGATTSQVPLTTAYNALNVPAIAAGGTYLDPTTNVKIYKLTSATFPFASTGYYWTHDYSEGGDEVSLPHTGSTRTVHLRTGSGAHWLVDFTPGSGVSNPRQLTGSLTPWMDLAFTFSNNPATPYYAYVTDGTTIRRFDIRSMMEVPGGGFPVTDTAIAWLHQAKNDSFFVWRQQNLGVVVGYDPATQTKKSISNSAFIQPRVDRDGRYVGITMTNNAGTFWDFVNNVVVWTTPGDPGIPFAHVASLRGGWIGEDWNMSYPPDFTAFNSTAGPAVHFPGPGVGSLFYGNGNWVQPNTPFSQQWAAVHNYGGLVPSTQWGTPWLSPGGVVLITQAGQRRLAFHPYNTTSTYDFYSFAKFSPDGAYILFTSDMNGSGRSDVFLAELPTTTNNPVPAISSLSPNSVAAGSPAFTLTVTGSNFVTSSVVQWNGSSRTTTYVSPTQLQAAILASDVAVAGTAQVTVFNPAPGGGTSGALPFTITQTYTLSVSRTGTGSGTVTSSPAGINCGSVCSASFPSGTSVVLTATAATNSTFGSWSGCDSVAGAQCTVLLTAARTVTATFQGIQGTPPTVSITAPAAGATVSGTTTVSANATSSVGIAWVQFQLDGANLGAQVTITPYSSAWNTTTAANGSHNLTAIAQDTAGLQSTSQAVGVTVANPPVISSVNASTISTSGANITWTTNTASDSQVEYGLTTSYGSATPINTTLVTAHAVSLTGLTAGTTYHYRVKSRDAQGNLAVSGDYTFTTAPAVSITAPPAGATVSATTTVSASATSSVGIAWVQFQLDGANLGAQVTTAPYSIAWNTTTVANGAHNLTAVAQDTAGLQATSQAVGVTVSNPPVIFSIASTVSSSGAKITWTTNTASDSQVEYGLTTSYGSATPIDTTLVTAHAVSLTGLTAGTTYHYRVKSRDAQGNLAVSGDYTFTTTAAGAPTGVIWINLVNATATGNSLQKTSGCDGCFDAGAVSQQQIPSGNGYAEFTATETTLLRVAGLTQSFTVTKWRTINFAIYLENGIAEVRENGVKQANTTFATGDVFRIAVTSGVITYSKNGVVFFTSTATPKYPLFFAAALANLYSTITNAVIAGAF